MNRNPWRSPAAQRALGLMMLFGMMDEGFYSPRKKPSVSKPPQTEEERQTKLEAAADRRKKKAEFRAKQMRAK